jgi:hypothetical protein
MWFGCVGFAKYLASRGESWSFLGLIYRALQLFVLQSGAVPEPVPWELEVARFLAPVVPAWAAVQALAAVFRDQLGELQLRRIKGHAIVCGLSERGMQLARDFRRSGAEVVAIESNEANGHISTCRELGCIVLLGDATDSAMLLRAGVPRARHLIAVTDDDGTNVEIAVEAHQVLARKRWASSALKCFVHIVDTRLCDLLRQHRMFDDRADPFEVRVFNVYQTSARQLLEDHPLETGLSSPGDFLPVHLVVLGFGQMGESVVLQAAKTGHYANGKRLRVTVVDRLGEQKRRGFLGRYPQFNLICDAAFLEADADGREFLDRLPDIVGGNDDLTTVVACFGGDSHSLACALSLLTPLSGRKVRILVRMSRETGLAALLRARDVTGRAADVHAFGVLDRSCTRSLLLDEELDRLAKAIHEGYVAERAKGGARPEADPALAPWELLDSAYKDSNRQQADHIAVKLRAVDCRSAPVAAEESAVEQFAADEVELLARMEHARYNAERFLAGWRWGAERDLQKRTSPYLVGWDELAEQIREYDREAVRKIPALLARIGQKILRGSDGRSEESPPCNQEA